MSDYTPTTDDVRETYERARYYLDDMPEEGDSYRAGGGEFDRWLAQHDREVAARALREAADELTPGDDKVNDWGIEAGLLRARADQIKEKA